MSVKHIRLHSCTVYSMFLGYHSTLMAQMTVFKMQQFSTLIGWTLI